MKAPARIALDLALPNADHLKAAQSELPIDRAIPRLVATQFPFPISNIALRCMAASRAAVPEAPIDEDSNKLTGKEEVASRHVLRTDLPTHDLTSDQVSSEALRGCV